MSAISTKQEWTGFFSEKEGGAARSYYDDPTRPARLLVWRFFSFFIIGCFVFGMSTIERGL